MADRSKLKANVASLTQESARLFIEWLADAEQLYKLYGEQQLEPTQPDGITEADLEGENMHLTTAQIEAYFYSVAHLGKFMRNDATAEDNNHIGNFYKMLRTLKS